MLTFNSETTINEWLSRAPEWVQEAYNNDSTVNRVIKQCALAGDSERDMLYRLAGAMYEMKNMWEATALNKSEFSFNPMSPVSTLY